MLTVPRPRPQGVALQASLLQREPPDHVCLAVLEFVASLGRLFMPQALQVVLSVLVPVLMQLP